MQYLIDTNILIYHLKNTLPENQTAKTDKIFIESFNISIISEIEFLGYKNISSDKEKIFKDFLALAKIIDLDHNIKEKAIQIKKTISLKTPDAIIAATAIVNNYILLTSNIKDFNKIKDLQLYNPFE